MAERRTGQIRLRVSPAELAAWRAKAGAAGLPLSDLLRQAMARTRSQRLRTVVRLPIDTPLREVTDPPIYQRIAPEAARFRATGLSDHAIGLRFRVTDKTAAKAIRWFLARSDGAS